MVLNAYHALPVNTMIQVINLVVPAVEVKLQMDREFVNVHQILFGLALSVLNVTILNILISILKGAWVALQIKFIA